MYRQIGILVSALILGAQLGSPARADQPSTQQLRAIASLLSADDYAGLRSYLRANPELLVEDTALSELLREFVGGSNDAAREGLGNDLGDALRHFSSEDSDTTDSPGGAAGTGHY